MEARKGLVFPRHATGHDKRLEGMNSPLGGLGSLWYVQRGKSQEEAAGSISPAFM